MANEGDTPAASRAALQASGLSFEMIQAAITGGKPVDNQQWSSLRQECLLLKQSALAKPSERSRAGLLLVESYCWEHRSEEAAAAAQTFFQEHPEQDFRQDLATVAFFAGEELQKLRRYDEALAYFRYVVQLYEGETEIWPGMDHLPRTYFRIWETLRRASADPQEIAKAAEALLSTFPESSYAKHIRIVNRQEGR